MSGGGGRGWGNLGGRGNTFIRKLDSLTSKRIMGMLCPPIFTFLGNSLCTYVHYHKNILLFGWISVIIDKKRNIFVITLLFCYLFEVSKPGF
jgi:hypothetical protein